jgi:hypothetical protein
MYVIALQAAATGEGGGSRIPAVPVRDGTRLWVKRQGKDSHELFTLDCFYYCQRRK